MGKVIVTNNISGGCCGLDLGLKGGASQVYSEENEVKNGNVVPSSFYIFIYHGWRKALKNIEVLVFKFLNNMTVCDNFEILIYVFIQHMTVISTIIIAISEN